MSTGLEHIGPGYADRIERQRQKVMQNGSEEAVLDGLETLEDTLYSADSYFDRIDSSVFISHQEFLDLNHRMADILSEGGEALNTLYSRDQEVYEEAKTAFSAAMVAASYASQDQSCNTRTPVQDAFGLEERLPESYTQIMDELGIPGDGELPI